MDRRLRWYREGAAADGQHDRWGAIIQPGLDYLTEAIASFTDGHYAHRSKPKQNGRRSQYPAVPNTGASRPSLNGSARSGEAFGCANAASRGSSRRRQPPTSSRRFNEPVPVADHRSAIGPLPEIAEGNRGRDWSAAAEASDEGSGQPGSSFFHRQPDSRARPLTFGQALEPRHMQSGFRPHCRRGRASRAGAAALPVNRCPECLRRGPDRRA